MVHANGAHHKGIPTVIGNNVTVSAGAIVHGATLEDFSYIGEGAQVMDGAIVRKHAAVAPGSVVTSGKNSIFNFLFFIVCCCSFIFF